MAKVVTIGNSAGILIPKAQLLQLGLKVGDTVEVSNARRRGSVRVSSPKEAAELADWTKSFIENYRPALEALAKK